VSIVHTARYDSRPIGWPTAESSRVAVDETAVQIGEEWCWLYTAIDLDTMVLLDVALFTRRRADPAAALVIVVDHAGKESPVTR